MLAIFYLVFGRILGGRFSSNATETPLQYALALFVGLGFFNFLAQNIGSAPTLIAANVSYVKTLSFPLEILSVIAVVNAMINLLIGLVLTALVLIVVNGHLYWSAICIPFYVACIFLIALGVSWGLSALAVFIRDSCRTDFSSTPMSGLPLVRSRMYRKPVLPGCMRTLRGLPR